MTKKHPFSNLFSNGLIDYFDKLIQLAYSLKAFNLLFSSVNVTTVILLN